MAFESLFQEPLSILLLSCGLLLGGMGSVYKRRVSAGLGVALGSFLAVLPLWMAFLSQRSITWIEPVLLGALLGLAGAGWANFISFVARQISFLLHNVLDELARYVTRYNASFPSKSDLLSPDAPGGDADTPIREWHPLTPLDAARRSRSGTIHDGR